jgi:1-acyl-sn-glycerol-3-phosphate acyltransferase
VNRNVYRFIGGVSWPITKFLYRLQAEGVENIPKTGGLVLAANHTSNFDPWALGMPLFPDRTLRFMAKIELFNPILKPFLNAGGAFPVRRGEADHEAIETAVRLAREGDIVVMFPEGTRRRKGLRKKFQPKPHTGAARIALAAQVPLVPAAVKGTDNLARLGPLRVVYGRPIPLDDLVDRPLPEAARIATERLMTEIAKLYARL